MFHVFTLGDRYARLARCANRLCVPGSVFLAGIDSFMSEGYAPLSKDIDQILTIFTLYEQQKYMFDNKVHKVENRIVSISQPWIRPIVRGKVKAL